MTTQKKSVLGRGLSALISKGPKSEVSVTEETLGRDTGEVGITASIDISRIKPNPFQPRVDFDETALEELTRSIKEKGVIQPVTIRRVPDGYQLISGERRLRAAQAARLRQIPAYIIDVTTDEEMLELALIENIQRETLNAIEVAQAYQRLMADCHLTQEDVAQRVGKERSTVTNFLRLLKLPQKVQDGLRREKIQMGHARALLALPTEKHQLRMYEKVTDGGLSVRKVEEMVRALAQTVKKSSGGGKPSSTTSSDVHTVEERLRTALGTRVKVKPKGGDKGEIVIEYYSLDDMERLLDIFESGR
jgi:ParB family chromosome partitioning protein